MRRFPLATLFLVMAPSVVAPLAARADCQAGIAAASRRAEALSASPGKAALLEQIQRADIARHEGDETECADQLSMATDVLDRIDAAKRRADTPPPR